MGGNIGYYIMQGDWVPGEGGLILTLLPQKYLGFMVRILGKTTSVMRDLQIGYVKIAIIFTENSAKKLN